MEIIPQQGPNGGQLHFGVAAEGGIQGPTASVIWTTYCAETFTFLGPCANVTTGIDEHGPIGLTVARTADGLRLSRTDQKALGYLQVFDAQGRIVTTAKAPSGQWELSTATWPAGLYLIRSVGTDDRILVTRWIV
jgi:hypothetical protein